jgi:short-subunit dehydrogenase
VDLADRDALDAAVARLSLGPPFDLVVLNAGISCVGRFEGADPERLAAVLALNLESPLVLVAGLLAAGKVAEGGTLVFVSSMSHYLGYPGAAVYAATKDGLASYARSLSVALAPRRIRVLTVFPGPTRTAHAERYAPAGSDPSKRMDPEVLARRVERAVARRRSRLVPGPGLRMLALAGRWFPRAMDRAMKRALLDRLDATPGR